jgi:PST family polysaccharide transporter
MLRRRPLFAGSPYLFLLLSTAIRLATGLILLKYLAWQFGPSTFGLLTQVMGIAAIFYLFAGGGITNGVIRNVSASRSEDERRRWMAAATTITVLASIVLAMAAIALAFFGSSAVFGQSGYGPVFIGISAAQVLVGFGNLALGYFSAMGDNRTFATIQIVGNILSLLLLVVLTQGMGLSGAVLALIVGQSVIGAVALWRFSWQVAPREMFHIIWDRAALTDLLSYAAVTASSVTAVPLAQLLIRVDMSVRLGWEMVGYWQAVAKISDANMAFVSVVMINYLLPQLSSRRETASARRFLLRFGAMMLGIFILTCGLIYVLRGYLLLIVYSEQFLKASSLVLPQLVGDALKVATLLVYFYFISRGRVLIVFVCELALGITLYAVYLLIVPTYGPSAPIYAFAAAYAGLFAVMAGLLCFAKERAFP